MLSARSAPESHRRKPMESGATSADLRPVEGNDADEELARQARALGHPTRVTILRALRRAGSASITELVVQLGLAQSTVSEHVRVLRGAGLVAIEDDAERGDYVADVHALRRLKALVGSL